MDNISTGLDASTTFDVIQTLKVSCIDTHELKGYISPSNGDIAYLCIVSYTAASFLSGYAN